MVQKACLTLTEQDFPIAIRNDKSSYHEPLTLTLTLLLTLTLTVSLLPLATTAS